MSRSKRWTDAELRRVVKNSFSIREVIKGLGLVPAGGNYEHIARTINDLELDTSHFLGRGWRKNRKFPFKPKASLSEILVKNSDFQSYKLKKRLFIENLKKPECEMCGWAEQAEDGRIPVELDHINGDRHDNRMSNLRILCPNCHSLQPTHRGKNVGRGKK